MTTNDDTSAAINPIFVAALSLFPLLSVARKSFGGGDRSDLDVVGKRDRPPQGERPQEGLGNGMLMRKNITGITRAGDAAWMKSREKST